MFADQPLCEAQNLHVKFFSRAAVNAGANFSLCSSRVGGEFRRSVEARSTALMQLYLDN